MASALLISILVATIAIPMRCAGDPIPKRGLKRMLRGMALFTTLWGLALAFYYFRLLYL